MSNFPTKILSHPNQQFLARANGKSFLYLADTWWFGLTDRWTDEDFRQAVIKRKQQGFTVIQLVVGIPPEIPFWSIQSHNHHQHPFLPNLLPNTKYLQTIDKRIQFLIQQGIIPLLVGNWGYHIDVIGEEKMKLFWQEIVKRYHDLPVIYCLTGEVDLIPPLGYFREGKIRKILQKIATLPVYEALHELTLMVSGNTAESRQSLPSFYPLANATGFKRRRDKFTKKVSGKIQKSKLEQRLSQWGRVAEYIKTLDPITPLTVHIHQPTTASQLFASPGWLDIDSLQSGHSDQANSFFLNLVEANKLNRPFLDLESPYEGILGKFYGEIQQEQSNIRLTAGSAGYAYGAQGLWNLNMKQNSFLTHWGEQTWQEALNFRDNSPLEFGF